MRIDLRIAQDCCHAIFKSFRDEVFQPFRLIVYLIPGILQNVMEKQFQQTMVPHQFPCPPLASRRQLDPSMFLIQNQRGSLHRQLLQHSRH